jgi:hypothetical protein
MALQWRVGSFGWKYRCPGGGHNFNRACINRGYVDVDSIPGYPWFRPETDGREHYCTVDYVLNLQDDGNTKRVLTILLKYLADSQKENSEKKMNQEIEAD